jgi:hypothetical protein
MKERKLYSVSIKCYILNIQDIYENIEIKVPRNLIQKFYQHPEPYGDGSYVVDLSMACTLMFFIEKKETLSRLQMTIN